MPRLGMCSNNLNYLQNKTSRLYHIRRTYKNVKCKNKNVLEVLKSSKYIALFEPRQSIKYSCKMCLVCKRNCLEDEKHFFIDYTEYESLRQQLYFHISENDATLINLTDHDKTLYLLRLDNDKTSHVIAKYAHLMFQKRKQFLSQKSN